MVWLIVWGEKQLKHSEVLVAEHVKHPLHGTHLLLESFANPSRQVVQVDPSEQLIHEGGHLTA